jgi:hypothetical protein
LTIIVIAIETLIEKPQSGDLLVSKPSARGPGTRTDDVSCSYEVEISEHQLKGAAAERRYRVSVD